MCPWFLLPRPADLCQDAAGVFEQAGPGIGQHDAAAIALEQGLT